MHPELKPPGSFPRSPAAPPSSLAQVRAILIVANLPARLPGAALLSALGVTAHLVRDLATGGVPLLWPRSGAAVPFWLALLGALAARAWLRAPVGPLTSAARPE